MTTMPTPDVCTMYPDTRTMPCGHDGALSYFAPTGGARYICTDPDCHAPSILFIDFCECEES